MTNGNNPQLRLLHLLYSSSCSFHSTPLHSALSTHYSVQFQSIHYASLHSSPFISQNVRSECSVPLCSVGGGVESPQSLRSFVDSTQCVSFPSPSLGVTLQSDSIFISVFASLILLFQSYHPFATQFFSLCCFVCL